MAEQESFKLTVSGFDSPAAYIVRHWRNGKRVCILSRRSGFDSSVTRSMLRWRKRISRLPLKQETASSTLARSIQAPWSMGKIAALQVAERSSNLRGVTARWCNRNTPAP